MIEKTPTKVVSQSFALVSTHQIKLIIIESMYSMNFYNLFGCMSFVRLPQIQFINLFIVRM